jgi:CDP-glucose 4,6-dehydratase
MDAFLSPLDRFRGQRVLITGHTGFKGSWLTYWLLQLGADVSGISLQPANGNSLFSQLGLDSKMNHYEIDIRDRETLIQKVSEVKPTFVFHLAAQPLVRKSYRDPFETFSTNVLGSVNVLDSILEIENVRSLVYVTSDKCYENLERDIPYCEEDRLGGHDPYSASKAAAEIVFNSYLKSFINSRPELGAASVRSGNVIGGGDWSQDRLVPDLVRSISSNSDVELRNPDAIRPWQHVLDPLHGYLLLALKLLDQPKEFSSSWNFGPLPADKHTVGEVAAKIIKVFGVGQISVDSNSVPLHEAGLLLLDSSKAEKYLGWKQLLQFDEAVNRTANWYKRSMSSASASILCEDDIQEYMKRISAND